MPSIDVIGIGYQKEKYYGYFSGYFFTYPVNNFWKIHSLEESKNLVILMKNKKRIEVSEALYNVLVDVLSNETKLPYINYEDTYFQT